MRRYDGPGFDPGGDRVQRVVVKRDGSAAATPAVPDGDPRQEVYETRTDIAHAAARGGVRDMSHGRSAAHGRFLGGGRRVRVPHGLLAGKHDSDCAPTP